MNVIENSNSYNPLKQDELKGLDEGINRESSTEPNHNHLLICKSFYEPPNPFTFNQNDTWNKSSYCSSAPSSASFESFPMTPKMQASNTSRENFAMRAFQNSSSYHWTMYHFERFVQNRLSWSWTSRVQSQILLVLNVVIGGRKHLQSYTYLVWIWTNNLKNSAQGIILFSKMPSELNVPWIPACKVKNGAQLWIGGLNDRFFGMCIKWLEESKLRSEP